MNDHEKQLQGSGRPDTSRDERKENGLPAFKAREQPRDSEGDRTGTAEGGQPGRSGTGPETTSKD